MDFFFFTSLCQTGVIIAQIRISCSLFLGDYHLRTWCFVKLFQEKNKDVTG